MSGVQRTSLDDLIDGAEDLLIRLGATPHPDLEHLRRRVDHAILDARRALARRGRHAVVRIKDIGRSVDDYVHDYPWLAVATAILAAGTAAFIAGAAVGSARRQP